MVKTEIILKFLKFSEFGNFWGLVRVVILIFLTFSLEAKEISVLPASTTGEVPSYFVNRNGANEEIARLVRHYLKRNFLTDVTDESTVQKFNETENLAADTKLTESQLNILCIEWESNFITKDSVDFGAVSIIKTEIYNCKNKSLQVIQSKIATTFALALEKHVEKSFRFLAPRYYDRSIKKENLYHEVHFFYDTNGAYSYYRKDFAKSLAQLINNTNLFLGITVIRKDKILTIPPSLDHDDVKRVFDDVSWSGTNQSETILQAIQSLKLKFSTGKKTTRKLFLLLSGSSIEKANSIVLALNDLRHIGFQIYVIIPNHSELNVIRELQKISRKSSAKILGVTDYQRIGTQDGYTQIFLNQFTLYDTNEEVSQPFQLESSTFKKWDASLVRAAVDTVTPYNMANAYEKISDQKILEKSEVLTNIESMIGNEIINTEDEIGRFQLALLQTKGEAIWIKIPNEIKVTVGKEVLIQTSVMLDSFSTYGIKNIPNETILLKINSSYPKSLEIKPSQSKRFMEENKVNQFSGYLKGVIRDVKKR